MTDLQEKLDAAVSSVAAFAAHAVFPMLVVLLLYVLLGLAPRTK